LKVLLLPLPILMTLIPLSFHCSSSKSLSDVEKAKLDPPLIRLFASEKIDDSQIGGSLRPDGTREYDVIVRSEHPEEIRALGVAVTSVFGDIIVVHVTIDEMRTIISLPSVHAVQAGSRNTIQQH
jgi:hypothetical protein